MMKFTFPVFNEYETKENEHIFESPPQEYESNYFLADMYPPSFHNSSGWKRDEDDCEWQPGAEKGQKEHWDTWRPDIYNSSNYNPISEFLRKLIVEAYSKVDDLIEKIDKATKASLTAVTDILRTQLVDRVVASMDNAYRNAAN